MKAFRPRLEMLPASQRMLWPRLRFAKGDFVLYGGTALALRLGHRASVDFDFFSFQPLNPMRLRQAHPVLARSEVLQLEPNTLTVLVAEGEETVKLSFFGGLTFQRVEAPAETEDGVCRVASLADLFATKLNTVYQRAEAKDYLDVYAILQAGLTLEEGLDFGRKVYGSQWNAMLPLQALCYFSEPGLQNLPETVKHHLVAAVQRVR